MFPLRDNVPAETKPLITGGIIALNLLAFLYQLSYGPEFESVFLKFGLIPYHLTHGQEMGYGTAIPAPVTLFTSMFMHGGWGHLIGNMWFLWIFGNNIEDKLGHFTFVIFYLLSGLAAAALQILINPSSQIPMVGASGAIAGVLGAYLITFPRARVLSLIWIGFFVRVMAVPAVFFLGYWILIQFILGLPTIGQEVGGTAWFAHIGGFVAGMVLFKGLELLKR
ncbi:MAG: rhomboid family intramembrane serine protease [candidate division Zixibacteria bacterium]|nr:rhomboid family intramembrane serine protease [candidate division Zixibacteria bacterium]